MSMTETKDIESRIATRITPQSAGSITVSRQVGRSVLMDMATKYGMEPAAFESTVRATCMPVGKEQSVTREQFAAFLLVAKEYGLNPLTKEIYAFPDKRGGITPIVGIDGWANIVNSHPAFDGMDFQDVSDTQGQIAAITCRIHRKDRSHPIEATEYLAECRGPTEPWRKWPRRMLRHKAMIQAARYAFGFAGIYDPDEATRISGEAARDVTPRTITERLDAIAAPKIVAPEPVEEAIPHDPETGEVVEGEPASDTYQLLETAREQAMDGRRVFDAWFAELDESQRAALAPEMPALVKAARAAN